MVQHMVFPAFILCIVFVVAPDMLDQGTVPVAKVLPSLVAVRLALHGKVNAELGLVVPMARIARLLPFMASGTVQLLENGLGLMQRHLLSVFQMGTFAPKDRDNRLRCRILRDLPLGVGNGNLTSDLAFHKGIHLALLQLIALFAQAIDKPDYFVGIAHGLGIGHDQLPFLAAQTRGVFLCQFNQSGGSVSRGRLRHERLSIQQAVDPIPRLRLGNGVGLFGCFQKIIQPVAGQGFHCPSRSLMDRKDFFSGFHKGQAGIVKLASVQFFVVGAVQRVIIASFRCLDIQVIAAFQTVGGLLRGFGLFQRSIPGNGKALHLRRLLGSLRHFAGGFQIRVNQGLQHSFYAGGHFLLLLRGQLGKYAVRVWLLGGLFQRRGLRLLLLGLPFFLKLGKVAVNGGNQFMGGGPDGFKGGFQLFQVLAGTPTGHIAKGIVGGVQPVMLAYGIGHAFSLHFAGAAVGAVGLLNGRGFRVDGVELGMGDLMDGCL